MNTNTNIGDGLKHRALIGCLLLALLATTLSIALSVLTGWQWGESLQEKLVMAAFGVLAVLSAHLLLALCQPASFNVRLPAIVMWLLCSCYVVYSHSNYFLSLQQQAGVRRAANVEQPSSLSEPKRHLSTILSDQARVKTDLANKSQLDCHTGCGRLKVQITNLEARLAALEAEADEVRRWQEHQDRQQTLRDEVRDDPVVMRLATWLGVTASQIGLVTGFLFSLILEGVACLCWYVALLGRSQLMTQSVMPPVTSLLEPTTKRGMAIDAIPKSEQDTQVEELIHEVRAGRLKLTVNGVREHCRCAQKKAAELKRLVEGRLNADTEVLSTT